MISNLLSYLEMLNFLYCFDKNYNTQALISISSLLNNLNEKVNISIIHDDPDSFKNNYFSKLGNSNADFNFYKFKDNEYDFPRLKNSHVSMATYYRIFLNEYIDKNFDTVFYLDADTVINKNISDELQIVNKQILEKNILFAASSEVDSIKSINRLNMVNNRYFNAGVMAINLNKWRNIDVQNKSLESMKFKYDDILWWDQDVLNTVCDGDYLELDLYLNFRANFDTFEDNDSIKIYHFLGDLKPWHPETVGSTYSNIYQNEYRKITNKKYHLEFKNKSIKRSYYKVYKFGKIKEIEFPISFTLLFIGKFFKYIMKYYLKLL